MQEAPSAEEMLSELDASLRGLNISPIKKDRLSRLKKQIQRQKMRSDLPVLSMREIRRFRLPQHEAIFAELTESGYINTVEFVKQLLHFQEKNRKKFGPGTAIWSRPQLIESKNDLELVTRTLSKAEKAHNSQNFAVEWDEMLHLAAHYAFGPDDWWWLGEQLLYQCVSMEYPGDCKKQEAIAYFIIGKYLVENGKKMDSGRYYLDMAREMTKGKSWNCKKILNKSQDTLFIESCRLLYKALTEEAVALMKTDPATATEICTIARKRAAEACDKQGEFEALMLKGRCARRLKNSTEAIATFQRALNRSKRHGCTEDICEANISLALAYLQHGKASHCLECLKELKAMAEDHDLNFYKGQAYRYIGQYFLHEMECFNATPLLMLAFYIFHDAGDLQQREKVRTWAAISAGEELFPAFITLIQNCQHPDEGRENLIKLINWIDEKQFFWTQESKFSFSYTSLRESVDLTLEETAELRKHFDHRSNSSKNTT